MSSAQRKLSAWLEAKQLVPMSEFEAANYDPPFTPTFLRRNEVLVRIKNDKVTTINPSIRP
jgi:hypothetical protein